MSNRNNDFVSLHNHTDNSLLDGLSNASEYLEEVQNLGQHGFGVTDHGNVHGIYDFLKKSKNLGIKGIPGCEFYVAPESDKGDFIKGGVFYSNDSQLRSKDVSARGSYLHLTVWAYNKIGLHNLFKLSTLSYSPERFHQKPRISFALLEEYNEGLIVSSGCPSSEISTRFLLGQDNKAYEYAQRMKDVFGKDRFFVEVMNHDMKTTDIEKVLLPKQLKLSQDLGLELLATNDCHYAHASDAPHHSEMLCIQSKSFMSVPSINNGGKRFAFEGNEYYLKTAEEMYKIFPDDVFPRAISNTRRIAEMVEDVTLDFDNHLRPKPQIPKNFNNNEVEYYKHLINKGMEARYGNASKEIQEEAQRRSQKEFDVISSSDFIGYMLVVADYLEWTKSNFSVKSDDNKILASAIGAGRGSVGGSIHAFLLGISEIDPIRHDLLFERFLSAGRGATYKITYDDGTEEEVIVSDTKETEDDNNNTIKKYIHQLNVGDIVEA